jgi:hopanoid biosynthesis associated radical SAM protein HpnH
MRYPLGFVLDSARHLVKGKLRGERKMAVMLSLDPLGSCTCLCGGGTGGGNGAASGESRPMLSVEQCLAALKECDTPVVAICGGEPLEYPEIQTLTREILKRRKHLFVCTDGTLIRRRLHMIPPYTNFFWNVKLDGTASVHDGRAKRPGLFAEAFDGVKAAKNAGFFVVVTTTIYPDSQIRDVAALYEKLHGMHVDGYMLSPHYPSEKLCREGSAKFHAAMQQRFREATELLGEYNLMNSPIYLEYLRGERELDCCAWGSPVYGPQGWSGPCYLLNYGQEKTYRALLENTVWENFGRGMNPRCEMCMSHAGYGTAAVLGMNAKAGDAWKMLVWQLGGSLGEKRAGVRNS